MSQCCYAREKTSGTGPATSSVMGVGRLFFEMEQNQDWTRRAEITVIAVRVSGEHRKLPSWVKAQLWRNKSFCAGCEHKVVFSSDPGMLSRLTRTYVMPLLFKPLDQHYPNPCSAFRPVLG